MKLSFSMKHWISYSWEELVETAISSGMQGIELYDIGSERFQGKTSPTNPEMAAATRRRLQNQGISLPCLKP